MTKILIDNIEEEIGELAEKEQHWDSSFYGAIGAFLGFGGVSAFFFIKKPEHYFYPSLIFGGISALFLLLGIFFYKWSKENGEKVKKLERKIKILKK
ncbi:MAG: hypothetical protein GBAus27B_000204 [Mycoplasmataceae bacterium]|nr:MAG: hypothetical protein GBAus27B_000204 [Mycoplasmataceae bacterium]